MRGVKESEMAPCDPEPDQRGAVIAVGPDCAGDRSVRQVRALLERRFYPHAAGFAFVAAERPACAGATITPATSPWVPVVPLAAVNSRETAQTCRRAEGSAVPVLGLGSMSA